MRVIGVNTRCFHRHRAADEVVAQDQLLTRIAEAEHHCAHLPAHAADASLINAQAFAAMKSSAFLVNVARGKVVDEPALIAALTEKRIAAAGIDCTVEEPLPATSPLWTLENALITPHTAGETQRYEDNVIDLLVENLDRLWRGETKLANEFV